MNTNRHRGAYDIDECADTSCVECGLRSSGRHKRIPPLASQVAINDLRARYFGTE